MARKRDRETEAILKDQRLMATIKASREDILAGRVREWSVVKKELGLGKKA